MNKSIAVSSSRNDDIGTDGFDLVSLAPVDVGAAGDTDKVVDVGELDIHDMALKRG